MVVAADSQHLTTLLNKIMVEVARTEAQVQTVEEVQTEEDKEVTTSEAMIEEITWLRTRTSMEETTTAFKILKSQSRFKISNNKIEEGIDDTFFQDVT